MKQLHLATNLGLIVFCWGDENNSKETIKFLKNLNIHGIIYDKMDKLSEKTEKVSYLNAYLDENGKYVLELLFKHFLIAYVNHYREASSMSKAKNPKKIFCVYVNWNK